MVLLDCQTQSSSVVFRQIARRKMRFVWLLLAFLLVFVWIGSFVLYHVAGLAIHVLLILAMISIIIHLFSSKKRA
jgi:uncharacterized membrane protein YfcA